MAPQTLAHVERVIAELEHRDRLTHPSGGAILTRVVSLDGLVMIVSGVDRLCCVARSHDQGKFLSCDLSDSFSL